jgi:predicted transposase YbfD/YdcC
LALVLVLLVLSKLCGEDHPYGISQWARARSALLCAALATKRQDMPSHNTYRRVLGGAVAPWEVQRVITKFLSQVSAVGQAVLLALDGKTVRGCLPSKRQKGMHLLAAYLPHEGVVLLQVAVESKENEISAAPRVLQSIDLRGKVVRGDALLTQRQLSLQVVEAGGEYVWLVKDNQAQLKQDIALLFQALPAGTRHRPPDSDFRTAQTVDKGHGRREVRTLTTSALLRGYAAWPYLEQVFKLERRVVRSAGQPPEITLVYGITSLRPDEADPQRLLELVRDYWGIENGLHYRRDKTLHEDALRMTNPVAAEVMTCIHNLLIGLMLQHGWRNLAQARRHYCAHLNEALALVLCRPA